MAMIVSGEEMSSGLDGDTGPTYPIFCTPPRSSSGFSHDLSPLTPAARFSIRISLSNGTVCRNVSQQNDR